MAAQENKNEQGEEEMLLQYNALVAAYLAAFPGMKHQDAEQNNSFVFCVLISLFATIIE